MGFELIAFFAMLFWVALFLYGTVGFAIWEHLILVKLGLLLLIFIYLRFFWDPTD